MNVILRQVPSRYRLGFYYVCHKCDYYVENDKRSIGKHGKICRGYPESPRYHVKMKAYGFPYLPYWKMDIYQTRKHEQRFHKKIARRNAKREILQELEAEIEFLSYESNRLLEEEWDQYEGFYHGLDLYWCLSDDELI